MLCKQKLLLSHLLLFAITLLPLIEHDILPFTDYPNHLARHYVIHNLSSNDHLSSIYQLQWQISPYLIWDMSVTFLQNFLHIYHAEKLVLILVNALLVASVCLLNKKLFGTVQWSTLLIYPFLFNGALALGFVNFLFGLSICLFSYALWLHLEKHPKKHAILLLLYIGNFFVHAITFGCFVLLILLTEFFSQKSKKLFSIKHFLPLITPLIIPAILWLFVPHNVSQIGTDFGGVKDKILALFSTSLFSQSPYDYHLLLLTITLVLANVFTIHRRITPILITIFFLSLIVPTRLWGIYLTDIRLPMLLLFLAIAACRLIPLNTKKDIIYTGTSLVLLVGLVTFRHINAYNQLNHCGEMIAEFHQAVKETNLTPTSPVLSIRKTKKKTTCSFVNGFDHITNIATIEKQLFSPDIFTKILPPLATTAPYQKLDVTTSARITESYFLDPHFNRDFFPYTKNWEQDFKYIFWLHFEPLNNNPYSFLTPLHKGSYFTLFENERYLSNRHSEK